MTPVIDYTLNSPRGLTLQGRISAWLQAPLMTAVGLCLGLVLTACGGGSDEVPAVAPAAAPSGMIGAAGGTVSAAGAQVIIPAGALTSPTMIAIERATAGAPALPNGLTTAGAMFAFTPHGTVFNVPITVSVPVDLSGVPAGVTPTLYKTNATGQWEGVPGAVLSGSVITAQVTGFSFFIPLAAAVIVAPPPAVARIAAGAEFSLAIDKFNLPYSWGSDAIGGLGNGSLTGNLSTAASMGTLTDVKSVSATSAAVAVRNDGTVWAWGYSGYVNCGFGTVYEAPLQIAGAANIVAASIGGGHTLLLRNDGVVDGVVLAFGCNSSGQLGRAVGNSGTAIVVPGLPKIIAVATGNGFSLALDDQGHVWSWGQGALGDGNPLFGPPRHTPAQIAGLSGVVEIAAGDFHALARRSDGSVVAWGLNTGGQLGDGTMTDRTRPTATLLTSQITAVAAAVNNSLAIRADGIALSWGENRYGQLGTGSTMPFMRATPARVTGLIDVVAIAAGSGRGYALAVRGDGSVWGWGNNGSGQLGDGTTTDRLAPVQASNLNLN